MLFAGFFPVGKMLTRARHDSIHINYICSGIRCLAAVSKLG